jgi:hypothetical protein
MLATHKGKSCASRKRWGPQEIPTFSRSRRRRPRRACGIPPVGAENPAAPSFCLEQRERRPRTFEHNGSVATLEDWFDPKRLDDDYVPTGHKRALIAFVKTL